ncbi:MAG: FtsX-like permease family protein [Chloroflexota bacterium]|nr:FtsX-like permease family protein [Chloroflexota bacterium]MDE2894764.1 FtsX-like permease family protein [Chloroflexota bacterium]
MAQRPEAARGETARELALLAIRRIMSAPRLSAVLLLGALLAVGLASSAPVFIEAVRDLGLRQTLADAEPSELDLRFVQTNVTADRKSVDAVESVIRNEVGSAADTLVVGRMTSIRSGGYVLRTDDQPFDPPDADHATFVAQSDIDATSEIVEGRAPADAPDVLEVAVEVNQAQVFGLQVGDELLAQPFWLGLQHETRVRIVGTISPSVDGRRWSTLDPVYLPIAAQDTELRFWTTRDGILGILSDQSPTLRLTLLQRFRTDLLGASAAEASAAADALERMTRRIAQQLEGVQQETALVDTLTGFRQRFQFAQSTLLMIVLQLVGAVLVYAVVAASMLAEQRTEDTAWLRSRGARQRDVALLHIVEAAFLTAPAIALGPLIGMGLVSLLGFVPPFDEALAGTGHGPFLPVSLPAEAWYLAVGAGALALLAQAIPTYRATRQTMVTTRRERGRPPSSWTQRALIDAAVAALGALLIFELQWAGDPIDSPLVGETRLDWLAVATPTVLLFVVGLIVLRLFPPLMRALARFASPWRSLTLLLGAWYLGRTPTHYARTVLLLTIAGALAVFAASFRTTLDTSYDDRALHAVGASVRVTEPFSEIIPYEEIEAESGASVAQIKRIVGAFDGDEESGRLQVAAIDSLVVADQLAERNVEWALPPSDLRGIAVPTSEVQGSLIEDFGGRLELQIAVAQLVQETAVGVKLQDALGRYWWYTIDTLSPGQIQQETEDGPEWLTLSTRLTDEPTAFLPLEGARLIQGQSRFSPTVAERPVAPLRLVSLDLALTRAAGEIWIGHLTYERRGETQILADFSSGRWEATPLEVGEEPLDFFVMSDAGARYRWNATPSSLRGVRYIAERAPLPALFSAQAMQQGRLNVGETVKLRIGPSSMTFLVVGDFETFPGYDSQRDDPLILIDRAAFIERLYGSAAAGVALAVSDELWTSAPLDRWHGLLEQHEVPLEGDGITTVESARDEFSADPLIVASWNGVFIGALAAVAIAAAFGLVVLTAVTAQARTVEFAVCQSVGMSMRQILGLIALEQLIVIGIGLGAGLIVGTQSGTVLLDFFALTPDGRDVVPPLEFIIDWPVVGILFGALSGLFALNLGAFLWFLRRIELHGALRLAA